MGEGGGGERFVINRIMCPKDLISRASISMILKVSILTHVYMCWYPQTIYHPNRYALNITRNTKYIPIFVSFGRTLAWPESLTVHSL